MCKSSKMVSDSTRVIQVTNIAPQATKDQMQTLFGYLGKIDDIRLYPTIRDVSCPVQSRICYVKYYDSATVNVAQHMTNTVFIDRALIVIPVQSGDIPDEYKALEMSSNGTLVPGLNTVDPRLPSHVINTLEGVPPNQVIQTHDPKLIAAGLPPYPPLPAAYDSRKIEEIRRTVLVIDVGMLSHQQLSDHFSQAGEVKYLRFCEREADKQVKYALIEMSEQESVLKALQLNGLVIEGQTIKVHHATQAISKPQTKSNEAAQREIEEALCRVKEAQNLISAAIDPMIGLLSKDKRRSRSRSRSRRRSRSRSRRSRSRHRSKRSRSRSRHRSRRSRSRHRHRTRSRSRHRSSRRSRSKSRHRSSRSKRDRSRDRDRDRKDKKSSSDKDKEKKDKTKSPVKEVEKEESATAKTATTENKVNGSETKSKASTPDKEKVKEKDKETEKERSPAKKKERSRSRDKKRDRSRSRRRSRSKSRKKRSRSRKRSKSRDRKRSRSRDRKRSRSRDRKRSRSRDRKRSKSKDKKRSRSRDRKRSKSRDRDRKRSRSRSRRSKSRSHRDSKTPHDRKSKEKTSNLATAVAEKDTTTTTNTIVESVEEKNSADNMDISNTP